MRQHFGFRGLSTNFFHHQISLGKSGNVIDASDAINSIKPLECLKAIWVLAVRSSQQNKLRLGCFGHCRNPTYVGCEGGIGKFNVIPRTILSECARVKVPLLITGAMASSNVAPIGLTSPSPNIRAFSIVQVEVFHNGSEHIMKMCVTHEVLCASCKHFIIRVRLVAHFMK